MTTETPNTSGSKLASQVRWALVAIAIVAMAVISGRQPENTGRAEVSDPATSCSVTVTADVLNVRAGPGTEFASVARLARGDVVSAENETSSGFRKITGNRWVASEFVRESSGCD